MLDLLKNLPVKWRIACIVALLLAVTTIFAFAALSQNKPVELFGIIKVGVTPEELLRKINELEARNKSMQATINSMISPDAHKVALSKLQETETSALRKLQEAEGRISQANKDAVALTSQGNQREAKVNQLTKDLEQAVLSLEQARRELQAANAENQKLVLQVGEMKKSIDASVLLRKRIQAHAQQLKGMELAYAFPRDTGVGDLYNNILRSLKKDLPNDSYVQEARELNTGSLWSTLGPILGNSSSQLRGYLETTYLK